MISITPSCWELFGQFLRLTGFEEYRLAVLWKQIMNQRPVKWVKEMNYHHHMLPTMKLPSGGHLKTYIRQGVGLHFTKEITTKL